MFRSIFGFLWMLWSALMFSLSWLFVWLAYQFPYKLFPSEKKYEQGFQITRLWGRYVLFVIGTRLTVKGAEQIDTTKQHIYVCNHQSQIDIPINFVSSPQLFVILSKKEAEQIPVVGVNLRHAHVTVNRKSIKDRREAMEKLSGHLEQGRSILIYPEGRRNRGEEPIGEFLPGAFLLAIQHNVSVVPVTIVGSNKINHPSKPLSVLPAKVSVYYDQPISSANYQKSQVQDFIYQTKQTMLAHF